MKRAICPSCKKVNGVPLLWGFPDEESLVLADQGEVILGGCVMSNGSNDRQCRSCGHQWQSSLFPQNERTSTVKSRTKRASNRVKSKSHGKTGTTQAKPQLENPVSVNARPIVMPPASISIWPSIGVFVLALLITFAIVGGVTCGDV